MKNKQSKEGFLFDRLFVCLSLDPNASIELFMSALFITKTSTAVIESLDIKWEKEAKL